MFICFSLRLVWLSPWWSLVRSIAIKANILTSRTVHRSIECGCRCRRKCQRLETEAIAEKIADVLNNQVNGHWKETVKIQFFFLTTWKIKLLTTKNSSNSEKIQSRNQNYAFFSISCHNFFYFQRFLFIFRGSRYSITIKIDFVFFMFYKNLLQFKFWFLISLKNRLRYKKMCWAVLGNSVELISLDFGHMLNRKRF